MQDREELKCRLAADVLRSYGKLRLRVTGASMLPAVRPGDIVWVSSDGVTRSAPGDIVLFTRQERLVVHRVVRTKPCWITRGDSLNYNDPPISCDDLLGRIVAIERGKRLIVPRRTCWTRIASWVLSRSELCTALLVRFAIRGRNLQTEEPLWVS